MTAKKAQKSATIKLTEGRGGKLNVSVSFEPNDNIDPTSAAHKAALDFVVDQSAKASPKAQEQGQQ